MSKTPAILWTVPVTCLFLALITPSVFAYEYSNPVDLTKMSDYNSDKLFEYVGKIVATFNGDIFDLFNNELKQYDSDLKKKTFLSSSEADAYRQKLSGEKAKYLASSFKTTIGVISDYDHYNIKSKGFVISPEELKQRSDGEKNKNQIDGFWFPQLKFWIADFGGRMKFTKSVIKVPESSAMNIEGKDSYVVAYFQLTGKTHVFKRRIPYPNGTVIVIDDHYPIVKNLTIKIEEKSTGNELFSQSF